MIYTLSAVLEGRRAPLTVLGDSKIGDALRLMTEKRVGQLPIVDATGKLSGIISQQTILSLYYHSRGRSNLLELTVDHCQDAVVTIDLRDDLFAAINLLDARGVYAVVIVDDDKPVGILTAKDMAHFFRNLFEGLMLVEEIELTLNGYIEAAFPTPEAMNHALIAALGPSQANPDEPSQNWGRLSLASKIWLITDDDTWPHFEAVFSPRSVFKELMEQTREIRNTMAHFSGRPDEMHFDGLRRAKQWLIGRPQYDPANVKPVKVNPAVVSSKPQPSVDVATLAALAPKIDAFIQSKASDASSFITVRIKDLERILGIPFPAQAYDQSGWWVRHLQNDGERAWLSPCWWIEDFDLVAGHLVFRQIAPKAMPITDQTVVLGGESK